MQEQPTARKLSGRLLKSTVLHQAGLLGHHLLKDVNDNLDYFYIPWCLAAASFHYLKEAYKSRRGTDFSHTDNGRMKENRFKSKEEKKVITQRVVWHWNRFLKSSHPWSRVEGWVGWGTGQPTLVGGSQTTAGAGTG